VQNKAASISFWHIDSGGGEKWDPPAPDASLDRAESNWMRLPSIAKVGPSGVDIGRHQVLLDRIGAYTFNKQAFVPQSLDHYIEILESERCGNLLKPIVSSRQRDQGLGSNPLFQS
jgi:hypothetical protein